jgi:hypothetical protein
VHILCGKRKPTRNLVVAWFHCSSVLSPCSLCLCGEQTPAKTHHRGTESTEDAQRIFKIGHYPQPNASKSQPQRQRLRKGAQRTFFVDLCVNSAFFAVRFLTALAGKQSIVLRQSLLIGK